MTLGENQELFAKYVVELLNFAWSNGYAIRLGEVQRTLEQQQIYVNTGRSKTLNSMHIKKCAIDLVVLKAGKICTRDEIKPMGDYWESLDTKNRWGGNWRGLVDNGKSKFIDAPHFELNC
jgi:hypothetical protein